MSIVKEYEFFTEEKFFGLMPPRDLVENGPSVQEIRVVSRRARCSTSLFSLDILSDECLQTPIAANLEGYDLALHYPLTSTTKFPLLQSTYTMGELLVFIRECYQTIYAQEAETATYMEDTIIIPCERCFFLPSMEDFPLDPSPTPRVCPICLEEEKEEEQRDENERILTTCNHSFHKHCLEPWLERSGKCPLCRSQMAQCKICDNTGNITFTLDIARLSYEEACLFEVDRPETDGIHGIGPLFIEELQFKGILVNPVDHEVVLRPHYVYYT